MQIRRCAATTLANAPCHRGAAPKRAPLSAVCHACQRSTEQRSRKSPLLPPAPTFRATQAPKTSTTCATARPCIITPHPPPPQRLSHLTGPPTNQCCRTQRALPPSFQAIATTPGAEVVPPADTFVVPVIPLEAALLVAAAALYVAMEARPVGWSSDKVVVEESKIRDSGAFAISDIAADEVIGRYPGLLRTPEQIAQKAESAPDCKVYAFATSDKCYLDPTDAQGQPSKWPGPGLFWPLPMDPTMAFVNEPQGGRGEPNVAVRDGKTPHEVLLVATRDVYRGEELFLDFGLHSARITDETTA